MEYFVKTFENTVKRCWNSPALDEYMTSSETYGQLASDIEKIHTYFEAAGCHQCSKQRELDQDLHGSSVRRLCGSRTFQRLHGA